VEGRERGWILVGLVAAAALVVAVAALVVATRPGSTRVVSMALLEPVATEGPIPFTEPVGSDEVELADSVRDSPWELAGEALVDGVQRVSGDTEQIYGGSGEERCDPAALAWTLGAEPDKAEAWAGVAGIAPAEVTAHLATLTPVVLTADTLVVNHGYEAGVATPRASVLQAGTAVLVDERGVPRVRCMCGNPLDEPAAPSEGAELDFDGPRWEGFDDQELLAVGPSEDELETLVVTDLRTGEPVDQPTGSGADDEEPDEEPEPTTTTTTTSVPVQPGPATTSTTRVAGPALTTTTTTTVPSTTTAVTLVPPGFGARGPSPGLFAGDRVPWIAVGVLVLMVAAAAAVIASNGFGLRMVVARWRMNWAWARKAQIGPVRSVVAWWRVSVRGRNDGPRPPD
jgi:hypothetical protein